MAPESGAPSGPAISTRVLLVASLLLGAAGVLASALRVEPAVLRQPLAVCPVVFDGWSGAALGDFDERTLAALGVDEYLHRAYQGVDGRPVSLYVGYYASQRQGDTMHSPLNCLPGAGWVAVSFRRMDIQVRANGSSAYRPIVVNRYVIEKGVTRQLVVYWYQAHGRVVASEYWGKIYLVLDAIRSNRTDGALVRIVAPIVTSEDDAESRAVSFARAVFPELDRLLP